MPDELAFALVLLLAGVLATAGLVKLAAPARFAVRVEALLARPLARAPAPLGKSPVTAEPQRPGRVATLAAVALALGELGLAALLLVGVAPRAAGLAALGALAAFTVALILLARYAPGTGCGCFGDDEPTAAVRGVLRNGALALAAAAIAIDPPLTEVWTAGPGPLLGAATVALGAACLWSLSWALAAP